MPRLLDLFCGAGGAAMGYHRAGFTVVGVDIEPQPDYPFEFHQADAMEYPLEGFDAYHASPPCQEYSSLGSLHPGRVYPDLYVPVRDRLEPTGRPWVIENVVGAPFRQGVLLCGSMFGMPIRRHRNFETSHLMLGLACRHKEQTHLVGIYGASDGDHPPGHKHPGNKRGPRQATTVEAREIIAKAPLLTWDHPQTHDCWPHDWELQDRTPEGVTGHGDWYWCVVCSKCGGARCDAWDKPFRCEQVRHHRSPHLYGNGERREVGA